MTFSLPPFIFESPFFPFQYLVYDIFISTPGWLPSSRPLIKEGIPSSEFPPDYFRYCCNSVLLSIPLNPRLELTRLSPFAPPLLKNLF